MATVTVSFGESTRRDDEISTSWIREQMRAREQAGLPVCANVEVDCGAATVRFGVGACGRGGGRGGPRNGCEQAVVDLMQKLGLTRETFDHGMLMAFVVQARRL